MVRAPDLVVFHFEYGARHAVALTPCRSAPSIPISTCPPWKSAPWRWREREVIAETARLRKGGEPWIFYEGPPTANGRPGLHHVWARAFKDLFPRFQTMRGRDVPRKGGVGLPRPARRARGREGARPPQQARDRGLRHRGLQRPLPVLGAALRRGLVVADQPQRRVDRHRRRLLDDGQRLRRVRLVARAPAVGRGPAVRGPPGHALLRPVRDRPQLARGGPGLPGRGRPVDLRALPAGGRRGPRRRPAGLDHDAVDADLQRRGGGRPDVRTSGCRAPTAAATWSSASAPQAACTPRRRCSTAGPAPRWPRRGWRYQRPFEFLEPVVGKDGWRVVAADYVTDDDGSGIVHIAPAFGEDDAQVGRAEDLPVLNPVDADATFDHRVTPWHGRFVKDADPEIIADLRPRPARGRAALRAQLPPLLAVRHAPHLLGQDLVVRPHRGAAGRPARPERDDRLVPRAHQARPVRALARGQRRLGPVGDRYWGSPLPIWRCRGCGGDTCVGSVAELADLAGRDLSDLDLHRPFVDEVTWTCRRDGCEGTVRRLPPVLDAWFDSGSMPSAQAHHPFATDVRARRRACPPPSPPTSSARRSTRPGAGSTRCWR